MGPIRFIRKENLSEITDANRVKFNVEKPKATVFRTLNHYKKLFQESSSFQRFVANPTGKFMLDIGPGAGIAVSEINKRVKMSKSNGPTGALGVDISKREDSDNAVVEFDILKSPLKNQADFVTMVWVLQHEPRRLELIMKGLEFLKYGGRLLFNTHFLNIATSKEDVSSLRLPTGPDIRTMQLSYYLHHYLVKTLGFKLKGIGLVAKKAYELQKPTKSEVAKRFGSAEEFERKFDELKSNLELMGAFFSEGIKDVPLILPVYKNLPFIPSNKQLLRDLHK